MDWPYDLEDRIDSALTAAESRGHATGRETPLAGIIAQALEGRVDCATIGGIVERIGMVLGDGEPFAGTRDLLRTLCDAGFRCLVASNTLRSLAVRSRTIERAGLSGYLSKIVLSSEIGWRKPHPAFYDAVCATSGARPDGIAFIGDTLDKDVLPPLAFGMHSVWVRSASGGEPIGDPRYLGRASQATELAGWV